jgi:hypothetical protein
MGGWYETQLSDARYQVSFFGNGATSDERASDFALLRACELAIENGYGYLVVEGSATAPVTAYAQMAPVSSTAGPVTIGVSAAVPITDLPNLSHTVVFFREHPQEVPALLRGLPVLDARSERDSLRRKYDLTD